jgi:hypothetical protein
VSDATSLRGEGRWDEAPELVEDSLARADTLLARRVGAAPFLARIEAALEAL